MTPSQRAEKILLLCNMPTTDSAYTDPRNGLPRHLKEDIAAQIREAEEEAVITLCEGDDCFVARKEQEAYQKGCASMREEATKVCDNIEGDKLRWDSMVRWTARGIAERIRKISVEGK